MCRPLGVHRVHCRVRKSPFVSPGNRTLAKRGRATDKCEVTKKVSKDLLTMLAETAISEVKNNNVFVVPGLGRRPYTSCRSRGRVGWETCTRARPQHEHPYSAWLRLRLSSWGGRGRAELTGKPGRASRRPEEAISRTASIRMFTTRPRTNLKKTGGRIEAGKLAPPGGSIGRTADCRPSRSWTST
jgi:hypothetical protein